MEVREPNATYLQRPSRVLTSAGELPEDWIVQPLGESMRLLNGRAFRPDEWSDTGLPIIRIQNLNSADSDFNYFPGAVDERNLVRPGDLLFAWSGTTGSSFGARVWAGAKGVLNQHIFKVIPDLRKLSPAFAYRLLLTAQYAIERQAHGFKASFVHIKKSDLVSVSAGFPPTLGEQDRIAEALEDADALIDALEQLLTKKRRIKQGAMQELLTGKRRLPGFTTNWETVRLGRLLKFQTGFPFPSHLFCSAERGLRLIRNRDLKSNDDVVHFGGTFDCEFVVKRGDVLVGMDGDFMPCLWDGEDALLNQRVGRVLPREGLDPTFAYYFLIGKLKTIEASTGSTTVKHLSHGDVEGIEAAVPELAEQMEIGASLCDLDMSITALESRLTKARALKQAMAQALLTGRIRISLDPQDSAAPVPPPEGVGTLGSGPARTQEPTA